MKANKQEFITAYCYSFGCSKKEAEKTYRTATENYKQEIIKGFKQDSKQAFIDD